jgi:ADP-sugar diphosphatase
MHIRFSFRGVGFVKIKSHCTLNTESQQQTITHHALPGICFLRGHAVTILVALICAETNTTYSLLVDQPRVPIGQASVLELPAGMLDDDTQTIHGTAVKELQEECGISIQPKDLVNLTQLIHAPQHGLALSAGGCDEQCQFLYLEKMVTQKQLEAMKGRLTGLREHGEVITLRVVPIEDVWRVSMDVKAMVALFLLEQLRKQGTLPAEGQLATPLEDVVLEE